MTTADYLLVSLAEECGETIKAVTKSLRFGLDDFHEKYDNVPNRQLLIEEFNDILAIAEILKAEHIIDLSPNPEMMEKKRLKVIRYMIYAKERNRVSDKGE